MDIKKSQVAMTYDCYNYRLLSNEDKIVKVIDRAKNRSHFYILLLKLFWIVEHRHFQMIVENPHSSQHYLQLNQNFITKPTVVDKNRLTRGDYFKKPTAYCFVNCEPTYGCTVQRDKKQKIIKDCKQGIKAGICSEERSMISPDYARNFICDFLLGKSQPEIDPQLF